MHGGRRVIDCAAYIGLQGCRHREYDQRQHQKPDHRQDHAARKCPIERVPSAAHLDGKVYAQNDDKRAKHDKKLLELRRPDHVGQDPAGL